MEDEERADVRVASPASPIQYAALPKSLSGTQGDFLIMNEIATQLFIEGEFVPGSDGKTFRAMDPSCNRALAEVAEASLSDVDRAARAARKAFDGGWRTALPHVRAGFLRKIAAGIHANLETIARVETQNVGKPIGDSRWEV